MSTYTYGMMMLATSQTKPNRLTHEALKAQQLAAQVQQFDELAKAHGLPSYSQLVKSLGQAIESINLLAPLAKVNPLHFGTIGRFDLEDVQKKLGNVEVVHN